MNGIENITARILADADAEVQAMREQAEQAARAIRDEYAKQAEKEAAAILSRSEKAAAERLERLESAARLERRKLELAARQQVLGEAFDKALDDLCRLSEQDYIDLLASLAAKAAVSGREELIFSEADRTRVGRQVVMAANERIASGTLTLSEQTRPMRGGFVMSDGEVEVNCSFETMVRVRREQLEKEAADVLFA